MVSRAERLATAALGSNVRFSDKGEKTLKGVPDPWRVFAVAD